MEQPKQKPGNLRIAVLIPCYNESVTIEKVIRDYQEQLPEAVIYVYDNNSTDDSARISREAGAEVRRESRQGKGNVVRSMFREIDADLYLMVDGDDTYPAEFCHELIRLVAEGGADMAVGDRLSNGSYGKENSRAFHGAGNNLVKNAINLLFRANLNDIMSGYRCFSREFVKTFPILSKGFEIETEMTLHALDKGFRIGQAPIDYRDRPEGSFSKLNTVSDGFRVIGTIFMMFKNYRPMAFFGFLSILLVVLGIAAGVPPVIDYILVQYVSHVPLAILATGLILLAALSFVCGVILDTVVRQYRYLYELRLIEYRERRGKEELL